jgi:type IV pilus assembly protein PilB
MYEGHDQAVAVLLRESGRMSAATLARLREACRVTGESLADMVVGRRHVERAEFLRFVAAHLGLPFLGEFPTSLPSEVTALVPDHLARRFRVVPWRKGATVLELVAADPFVDGLAGDLSFALGREVQIVVADPTAVTDLLGLLYGGAAVAEEQEPGGRANGAASAADEDQSSASRLERQALEAPVARYVDSALSQAINDHASDIHFEPFEGEFRVRCRVDGTLREVAGPPPALALGIVSRLKVLAGLNIAERRRPQDGRIRFPLAGRAVDLRVSTLPTQAGESVVLRVLDQTSAPVALAGLGLPGGVESGVREVVHQPNGMLLVTGPTGSGKTTTLYGCLRLINSPERKILTAEDPVEYEIEGIVQLAVNPAIGLTFASALRSFLRQDPDVLMVGEVRDQETAGIAVQAALTGHLVLSTLHTNDAAGAVTRLVDMGVEPFLLAATLEAVLAQRLVRRICPACREEVPAPVSLLAELVPGFEAAAGRNVFQGRGCPACGGSGYKGRVGLFEWLRMTESLRELILARAPAADIQRAAAEHGMETMRAAGLRAILEGVTTVEEVMRLF